MPAEVTKCFEGQPGKYGRDLISTAGYMYKGDRPGRHLVLREAQAGRGYRRPDADGPRAQPELQAEHRTRTGKNYVDEVRVPDRRELDATSTTRSRPVSSTSAIVEHPDTASLQEVRDDPEPEEHFLQNSGDRTWYLTMNLTQPPFDDIHVRRAMNWIMDKAALRQTGAARRSATIANHIVPDSLFGGQLADYKPYRTPGDHGSVAKAKAAMKGSKYAEQTRHVRRHGVQERAADRRRPRGRPGHGQHDPAGREEDRHHVHRPHRSTVRTRRSRRSSKNVPIAERPGLGQGLRRRADVLLAALRRPHDHPERQHELLARRDHASRSARPSRSSATAAVQREDRLGSRASTRSSTSAPS